MSKQVIVFLLIGSTLLACKSSFDKQDLIVLNTYNVGDTLVFQNDNNLYDSIEIIKKEFTFNNWSEGNRGGQQMCMISYRTIPPGEPHRVRTGSPQDDLYSNEFYFLTAIKLEKDVAAKVELAYSGFDGIIPVRQIEGVKDEEYFEIPHNCIDCMGIDSTDVIRVRWKPGAGIIWYQKKDSSVYTLIAKY